MMTSKDDRFRAAVLFPCYVPSDPTGVQPSRLVRPDRSWWTTIRSHVCFTQADQQGCPRERNRSGDENMDIHGPFLWFSSTNGHRDFFCFFGVQFFASESAKYLCAPKKDPGIAGSKLGSGLWSNLTSPHAPNDEIIGHQLANSL